MKKSASEASWLLTLFETHPTRDHERSEYSQAQSISQKSVRDCMKKSASEASWLLTFFESLTNQGSRAKRVLPNPIHFPKIRKGLNEKKRERSELAFDIF